jgi:expansin (peptidoglycan-binding protein)
VAINSTDFRDSKTCSACMEVTGPLGTVTVEVVENCGGACVDGEIELSREAFELVADASEGHADVSWRLVPCQRTGPIAFAYEPDSHEWFAGIQIRNPALPVAELDIRFSDAVGWVTLEMDGWNHFPISDDLGSGPFDFRVRAIDGQELLEENIEYVPGGVVQGTGQFEI